MAACCGCSFLSSSFFASVVVLRGFKVKDGCAVAAGTIGSVLFSLLFSDIFGRVKDGALVVEGVVIEGVVMEGVITEGVVEEVDGLAPKENGAVVVALVTGAGAVEEEEEGTANPVPPVVLDPALGKLKEGVVVEGVVVLAGKLKGAAVELLELGANALDTGAVGAIDALGAKEGVAGVLEVVAFVVAEG